MSAAVDYERFIESKSHAASDGGFDPSWMPPALFDFQAALVQWAQRKGRAAIYADCGLGKSPIALTWAENIVRREQVLTPFMGVGSEVYESVVQGRLGIGIELKPSYFRQAVKNVEIAAAGVRVEAPRQSDMFADQGPEEPKA